jgi:hypothetical protein
MTLQTNPWVRAALGLLPALGMAAGALHFRASWMKVDPLRMRTDVVHLTLEGRVVLPVESRSEVLHAVLVHAADPSWELRVSEAEREAFRWRLPGQAPYRPRLPGLVFEGAHEGKPVELEFDVSPATRAVLEKGAALAVRPYAFQDKALWIPYSLNQDFEKVAWIAALIWLAGACLLERAQEGEGLQPQAAP